MTEKTIVVGVDGSETAFVACREAAELAAAIGARLHIVTAIASSGTATGGSGSDKFRVTSLDLAEQTLADVTSRLPKNLDISTAAASGKPAEVILEEAERVDATVIVVGSLRMRGVKRVLGSIANDVAHHAQCSVHIVKTD